MSNDELFYTAFGGWARIDLLIKLAWKSFATPWSAGVRPNMCDTNKYGVVNAFDGDKFMGIWYEQ